MDLQVLFGIDVLLLMYERFFVNLQVLIGIEAPVLMNVRFFRSGRQTLSRQIRTFPDRIYKRVHSPFGCHHAGVIPGPAISTNYISQIGAHLKPHDQQRNQQRSHEDQQRSNFSQLTLLSN